MKKESFKKTNKVDEIVYLRGFAILAVIMIHTAGVPTLPLLSLGTISHYAIPLFIFISGFVLSHRYKEKIDLQKYFFKRFISIIPQYLIFSIIYILYNSINSQSSLDIKNSVKLIILGDSYFHLWYIILIIQFYLLFPIIKMIYKSIPNKVLLFFVLLLFQFQYDYFFNFYRQTISTLIPYEVFSLLTKAFFSVLFYFVLGIYVSENYVNLKRKLTKFNYFWVIIPLIIVIIRVYLTIHSDGPYKLFWDVTTFPIMDLILFVLLFRLASSLSNKKNNLSAFVHSLGTHSFGIYLTHIFFLEITKALFDSIPVTQFYYLGLYVLTLLQSYFVSLLLSYLPFSNFIIGVHQKIRPSVAGQK
jgi:peptidoglycan/LPS O-acetylase OafA/YrhL